MEWKFEEGGGKRTCVAKPWPYGTYLFYTAIFFMVLGGGGAFIGGALKSKPATGFGILFFLMAFPLMFFSFFVNDPSTTIEATEDSLIVSCVYRFSKQNVTVMKSMGPEFVVRWHSNLLMQTPGGPNGGRGIWNLVIDLPVKEPIWLGESQSKEELKIAAQKMTTWLLGKQSQSPGTPDSMPPRTDDIPRATPIGAAMVALCLVLPGVFCCFWGGFQYHASKGCSPTPVECKLSDLEAGMSPPDFHVRIGEHVAVYSHSIVRVKGTNEPTAKTRISWAKYPILSRKNPFFKELNELANQYGGVKKIPKSEYPEIKTFSTLVLTRQWKRYGEIPDKMEKMESVEGLIINRIAPLTNEQKRLINGVFPKILTSELWILEKERHPYSAASCMYLIGFGIFCLVLAARDSSHLRQEKVKKSKSS